MNWRGLSRLMDSGDEASKTANRNKWGGLSKRRGESAIEKGIESEVGRV